MSKESTKAALLEAGLEAFLERGYNHCGIEAVLQSAGVPKGSFYYYFESKEDFGLQVIDRCVAEYDAHIDRSLGDESLAPLARLRSYFEGAIGRLESRQCRNGCLVGRLSQEMADQSEAFRARLEEVFERWVGRIAECLDEAKRNGEIPLEADTAALASFLLNSWQGAVLRAKSARTSAPLTTYLTIVFGSLLRT